MTGPRSAQRSALAKGAVAGCLFGAAATWLAGAQLRPGGDGEAAARACIAAEVPARPAAFAPPGASIVHATTSRGAAGWTAAPLPAAASVPDVDQQLKDLLTLAWNDKRDMRGKLEDFLAEHPGSDGVAIASKGVYELGGNADVLPDQALRELYLDQEDAAFKRVLAQVASMRGDNALIDLHVAEAGLGLRSADTGERKQALVELARTHHAAAADLAAPLLRDADTAVVLDALLALRATGNERHVAAVQALRDHPDEPVRWLASEVVMELRMLSEHARTRVRAGDVADELPPLPMPAAPMGCMAGL